MASSLGLVDSKIEVVEVFRECRVAVLIFFHDILNMLNDMLPNFDFSRDK